MRTSAGRRPPRAARAAALVATVVAAVVGLAGCSGSSSAPRPPGSTSPVVGSTTGGSPSAPSATPTVTPSAPAAVLPLTGLPGTVPDRPALVVKIENSAAARPQRGLQAADIVVEELVEGGITRFAAMYHSRAPGVVGPVRSVRNVDAQIAGPTRGVLAFSGGAKVALRVVRRADVRLVQSGDVGGAFFRAPGRSAPHNLYLRTGRLWAAPAASRRAPPAPYLEFAAGGSVGPATGRPVTRLALRFSAAERPSWRYDPGRRLFLRSEGRRPAVEEGGARLTATTVLVLRVRVGDAGYRDPAGNPVPETRFTGGGTAVLASGGTVVTGRWTKDGPGDPLRLTGPDGGPLPVPPGRTWVELLPVGAGLDTG